MGEIERCQREIMWCFSAELNEYSRTVRRTLSLAGFPHCQILEALSIDILNMLCRRSTSQDGSRQGLQVDDLDLSIAFDWDDQKIVG